MFKDRWENTASEAKTDIVFCTNCMRKPFSEVGDELRVIKSLCSINFLAPSVNLSLLSPPTWNYKV